jgi:aryl-alcohol dehydrogenase-like predicted oxidoreductase
MAQALSTSERHGWARFVSMQNHYNLLYREEEREMIPLCIHEGIGVIPWSPLARGALARPRPATEQRTTQRAKTDTFGHDMYEGQIDWEIVDAVQRIAKARGVSAAQVALAWLLARPGVTAPIVGASKLPQLQDATAAVELELTPEEMAALEAPYRPHKVIGI